MSSWLVIAHLGLSATTPPDFKAYQGNAQVGYILEQKVCLDQDLSLCMW